MVRGEGSPGAAAPAAAPTVCVEIVSWVTKFVGGDGTGRRVFDEPLEADSTVRSVLARLSARHPELQAALWHGTEIGEHIEVLVNDAVLGIAHTLDSRLAPGDRVTLLGQYMGG
jgi:molybdopterin converting factor small subunit